jgi:hypothetical protein
MKKIEFYPQDNKIEYLPPHPAIKSLPDWYRNLEPIINYEMTAKKCIPILDVFSAGYIIPLSADMIWNETEKTFSHNGAYQAYSNHTLDQVKGFDLGDNFYEQPYKFINPWFIKTPKGYSTLFIHPANRDDLPFRSFFAVVDTDKHPLTVNFPFFMKKGFSGIIESGTPMIQAIPFKRESWTSKIHEQFYDQSKIFFDWVKPPLSAYKRNYWSRKDYK